MGKIGYFVFFSVSLLFVSRDLDNCLWIVSYIFSRYFFLGFYILCSDYSVDEYFWFESMCLSYFYDRRILNLENSSCCLEKCNI